MVGDFNICTRRSPREFALLSELFAEKAETELVPKISEKLSEALTRELLPPVLDEKLELRNFPKVSFMTCCYIQPTTPVKRRLFAERSR